jgi:hypothetical protein
MTERDFEVRLRAGLRQMGDEAAPGALRASVIAIPDVVPTAPQRRLTPGWRFPPMNRFAPAALAATAVVVVILIGISIFARSPEIGPSPIPGPTDSSTAEPTATSKPAAPASWAATGTMSAARFDFTATLLLDGRVLVTGGDLGYQAVPRALASAELYDPATGTWTATGGMLTGRYRHTATLLADGKVLVAGGNVNDSGHLGSACCLASAELYDPATGAWTATGRMIDARVDHTATRLLDGTVLVAGGANGVSEPGAELYDPATGTWAATGPMIPRHDHSATLLLDGRVFVIGGSAPQAVGELYDPRTRSWSETDCCTDDPNRFGPYMTATLLGDGKVLVAGGLVYDSNAESYSKIVSSPAAVLYDPVSGTWTGTGSMLFTRQEFTATLLSDGTVLVVGGGERATPRGFDSAELYDPSTGTWTATASMGEGRFHQLAVLLLDGRVLVAGGSSELADVVGFVLLPSAELYTPGG